MPSPPAPVDPTTTGTRLDALHPAIAEHALDAFVAGAELAGDRDRLDRQLHYLDRLVDVASMRQALVTGCGPVPVVVQRLAELGFDVTGLEVERSFVESAQAFVGDTATIVEASLESMPVADASMDLIWCEDVLEHVDRVVVALSEMHRVLRPGGVALVATTNRLQLLPSGHGEFTVPLFGWLPAVVRESFVFQHLHRDPSLARYTSRPAVHWFTYAELCRLGRAAGFGRFYSLVDLIEPTDPAATRSRARLVAVQLIRRSPWVRALALTQVGHTILMVRRLDA